MSNKLTLADIQAAAEAQYGSTDIELSDGSELILRNPLRMTKGEREALTAVQNDINKDEDDEGTGEDQSELLVKALRIVAAKESTVDTFLSDIANADGEPDMALLAATFKAYVSGTQSGEASASQN